MPAAEGGAQAVPASERERLGDADEAVALWAVAGDRLGGEVRHGNPFQGWGPGRFFPRPGKCSQVGRTKQPRISFHTLPPRWRSFRAWYLAMAAASCWVLLLLSVLM